jgi:hypothetical protein
MIYHPLELVLDQPDILEDKEFDLEASGSRYTLSVFDTVMEEFIYCEYLDDISQMFPKKQPQFTKPTMAVMPCNR